MRNPSQLIFIDFIKSNKHWNLENIYFWYNLNKYYINLSFGMFFMWVLSGYYLEEKIITNHLLQNY